MLKNLSQLEVNVADKVYRFSCDMDAPLSHVKEVLLKFLYYVGQIEEQVMAQQKEAQEKADSENKEALAETPKEGENGNQ